MPTTGPRYSMDEFEQRGEAVYESAIRPWAEPAENGKCAAIDIETGGYEIDADEVEAVDRLYARLPDAQPWLRRVGYPYFRRFGGRRPAGPV